MHKKLNLSARVLDDVEVRVAKPAEENLDGDVAVFLYPEIIIGIKRRIINSLCENGRPPMHE
jgi:hypothetical protein